MSLPTFDTERHIRYFAYSLQKLPEPYTKLDTNRLTLVHFAVQALDLLGVWDDPDRLRQLHLSKPVLIEWIYSLQLTRQGDVAAGAIDDGRDNDDGGTPVSTADQAGFLGGTFLGESPKQEYLQGHIAMTYTALVSLRTLGDDLSRINASAITASLKSLQQPDGSFNCVSGHNTEHDLRFLYCACVISYVLQDWSGCDVDRAVDYIRSCRSFDGAIGLIPGQEGHGGSTFCGTAALTLMGKLNEVLDDDDAGMTWRRDLVSWCVRRQIGGMQGRPGKAEDTCYSYWIGGTLRLLGQDRLLQQLPLRNFIMTCQTPRFGGFGKMVGAYPDMLHAFYSLAWLSLSNENVEEHQRSPIHALNCTLGVRQKTADLLGAHELP